MKLFMLMKNISIKSNIEEVGKNRETCFLKFLLKFEIFLRSFLNTVPGPYHKVKFVHED